jgi:predicted nucleic acid-binding protein
MLSGAELLLEATGRVQLVEPAILFQEFANAAWLLQRRGLLLATEVDRRLAELEAMPLQVIDDPGWVARALAVARRFGQPRIFDAIYLACADDLGAELWTCDRRFVNSFGAARPANLKLCPDDVTLPA